MKRLKSGLSIAFTCMPAQYQLLHIYIVLKKIKIFLYVLTSKKILLKSVPKCWTRAGIYNNSKWRIVKIFALSKMNYIMTNFEVSKDIVDALQADIFDFIWENKKPKIKNDCATQDLCDGGIKIPHVDTYIKASRVTWIKRLCNKNSRNLQYLLTFLPAMEFKYFLKCNYNPNDLPLDIPTFYFQVLVAWFALKTQPVTPLDIRREHFIFNQYITIDHKYVYIKNLINSNIIMINDIVYDNGSFLSYQQFIEKYGNVISHFNYMSLIDAIPIAWKNVLKNHNIDGNICHLNENLYCKLGEKAYPILKITSSDIYWHQIKQYNVKPTCINSWNERIDITTDPQYWGKIFTLPFNCLSDIRIREFQLKILHRFYPTQKLVSKWDGEVSPICNYCKSATADILHTFCECKYLVTFWQQLSASAESKWGMKIPTDNLSIIFGQVPYTMQNHCINHIIMYAKYYLHKCRYKLEFPTKGGFLTYYKHILNIEKNTYTLKYRNTVFKSLFKAFILFLE